MTCDSTTAERITYFLAFYLDIWRRGSSCSSTLPPAPFQEREFNVRFFSVADGYLLNGATFHN